MQSQAQRIMIMVLPIVFLPFILGFPAGLMIYWLTTNLWTTGQGIVTRRLMPKPAIPPKRTSRTPPKDSSPQPAVPIGEPQDGPAGTSKGSPRRVKKKRGGGARR